MNPLNTVFSGGEEPCSPKQIESPSILDTLKRRQISLVDQLNRVNAAIDALEKSPEVMNVLELVARAR